MTLRPGGAFRVGVDFYLGFAVGLTWAHDALWINLGPMQVVIERG